MAIHRERFENDGGEGDDDDDDDDDDGEDGGGDDGDDGGGSSHRSPIGISVYATRDLVPPKPNHEMKIRIEDIENSILFAIRGEISFGGESTMATGIELRKKKEEDRKAKQMTEEAFTIFKNVRDEENKAEEERFEDSGKFTFSFFLRYFSNDCPEWMDEYVRMLPQPNGDIGRDVGGVGGVGFVYELGEEELKEKFRGTSAEFHSNHVFARCFEPIARKHFDLNFISEKALTPMNVTLRQFILYVISQADSRTFEGAGWIPFIDFVNGSMVPSGVNSEKENITAKFNGDILPQGPWQVLKVVKPVKKGDEISLDYGVLFDDTLRIMPGIVLKYGVPDLAGYKAGCDSVAGVRLDIAQVYPSFLPLQKEYLKKYAGFGQKEVDDGVWLSCPPPEVVDIRVVEPTDPFVRQLGIVSTVTDLGTLQGMMESGRLRIPHLDVDDLMCAFRAFISATLAGPAYQKKTTQEWVAIWEDTTLPYVDRILARLRAAEREVLLVWDRAFCRALTRPTLTTFKMMDSIPRCAVCGRSIFLMKCARCKSIQYCRVQCQKKDWPRHKALCKKE